MIPPDIHILHLSDLHISNGAISHVLSVLLSDITGQLMGVKNLIIAVTGDVIAEGDFDANEEAAFLFFKRLHDMIPLGCAVLDFLMVPGNHDVVRPSYKEGSSYLPSSDRYEGLQARVNELFESNHNQTFGVSIVPFNQRTIRIVRTDTSCNATPEDIRKQVKKAIQRDGDDRTTLVDEICAQRAEDYGKKFEAQTKTLRARRRVSLIKNQLRLRLSCPTCR